MDKLSILEQPIRQRVRYMKAIIGVDSEIEIDTLNWVLNEISSFGLEATTS
jgi:hypothetical protein